MKNKLDELRTLAWITSGSRYNAARRLARKELISTSSLSFFSAICIILAFYQKIYSPITPEKTQIIDISSIIISIFVLTISLIEWGNRSSTKSETLYENAEKLNAFHRKINILKDDEDLSQEKMIKLQNEYDLIKSMIRVNHKPIDYEYFMAEKRFASEFLRKDGTPKISEEDAQATKFIWFLSDLYLYIIFWIITIIFIIKII